MEWIAVGDEIDWGAFGENLAVIRVLDQGGAFWSEELNSSFSLTTSIGVEFAEDMGSLWCE